MFLVVLCSRSIFANSLGECIRQKMYDAPTEMHGTDKICVNACIGSSSCVRNVQDVVTKNFFCTFTNSVNNFFIGVCSCSCFCV